MGVLSIFTIASKPAAAMSSGVQKTVVNHTSGDATTSATSATEQHTALSDVSNALATSPTAPPALTATSTNSTTSDAPKSPRVRRFSIPLQRFFSPPHDPHKPTLSHAQEQQKRLRAVESFEVRGKKLSAADRRARESALVVRALIIGPRRHHTPE
ncbi:hypothetical protein EW146_g10023 [Bondarzewia mesenterica]|uniref:Uncharacterized protein n=1 Tax=Bondarzewia mesenterica TaxID=1095465 RepID=A0A4S4L1M5_9AGAM|nr:hypothetical protein EW146_g10023 [Bondarzewia mesenterica]